MKSLHSKTCTYSNVFIVLNPLLIDSTRCNFFVELFYILVNKTLTFPYHACVIVYELWNDLKQPVNPVMKYTT